MILNFQGSDVMDIMNEEDQLNPDYTHRWFSSPEYYYFATQSQPDTSSKNADPGEEVNMKFFTMATSVAMTGLCLVASFAVNATMPANAAVYATEQSKGSISAGGKDTYTKSFAVVVANLSDKDLDLSKFCLEASAPDHQKFTPDKVDEKLSKGLLKKGQSAKGTAVFASENAAVQQTALIKLTDDCK